MSNFQEAVKFPLLFSGEMTVTISVEQIIEAIIQRVGDLIVDNLLWRWLREYKVCYLIEQRLRWGNIHGVNPRIFLSLMYHESALSVDAKRRVASPPLQFQIVY